MTASQKQGGFFSLINKAAATGRLRRLVFSKPKEAPAEGLPCPGAVKIVLKLCLHKGETVLAAEGAFADGKVKHFRFPLPLSADALLPLLLSYRQGNLITEAGDAEYREASRGRELLLAPRSLAASLGEPAPLPLLPKEELNRKKNYLLTGEEPFLKVLGISDENGRVYDKKQAKFRQINAFLDHLGDTLPHLPEGDLTIYDLCSGKSYLSFALYHYFTVLKGRGVDMLCVDRKADVIDFCADVARQVGFRSMRFLADDIRNTPRPEGGGVDLVVSLHACDIATDLVLSEAVALGARVILSTPCCQATLNSLLTLPRLPFAAEQPHLRAKLAATLTDGLRVLYLESHGYAVTTLELTDPENTPKNTLIRAHASDRAQRRREEKRREYEEALTLLLGENKEKYLSIISL